MSIPPLVCSTPPPPEQCEDDKDHEDFEYNLSHEEEDEDNDFGCGSFTTFHQFNTGGSNSKIDGIKHESMGPVHTLATNNKSYEVESQATPDVMLNHSIENEEDNNIEDLNLNVNEESVSSCNKDTVEFNENVNSASTIHNTVKDSDSHIPCSSKDTSQIDGKISSSEDNAFDMISPVEPQTINVVDDKGLNRDENNETIPNIEFSTMDENNEEETNLKSDEIDFEDFDEFQFATSNIKSEAIINSEDPWVNDNSEEVAFGDFTANFEDDNSKLSKSSSKSEIVSYTEMETNNQIKNTNCAIEDDDFGDFDEFKCSSTEVKENESENKEFTSDVKAVPVLNFCSDNEHQLMESINKVIQTIFQEEITESNNEILSNLETSLGETWAYLKDTDNRQPYMVNWNNSLAQKTLLKALCIDSRNILFGPKWSSNMPKYAANLNTAPLMPQKQSSQGNYHPNEQAANSDKSSSKVSWVDPFTSDGQESCNAESESARASESGPTDLDVFEAAVSPKTDKIYSSTLHIQPMRQINLPDTHIFTPTDSETPRSKTIHYDTTHTILMPQQVNIVKTLDNFSSPTANSTNSENDEYWEFQDFKGSSEPSNSIVNQNESHKNEDIVINKGTQVKQNLVYETQVLQPIKLEPTMPTLNWPDPGEVKETFEDFSDFISISQSGNEKPIPPNIHLGAISTSEHTSIKNEAFDDASQKTIDQIDDDFDTFQSAFPTNVNNPQIDKNGVGTNSNIPNISNLDSVFSKVDILKSDNKSQFDINPNIYIKQNSYVPKEDDNKLKMQSLVKPILNSNILQPTPLSQLNSPSFSQPNQQNTGQILQPLSLESYSQINWPNPGIDLQDLSRFNPVESLQSLKSEASSQSKNSSPVHNQKILTNYQAPDEDIWGEFVSSVPKPPAISKKPTTFVDDDEWTDFVSSPSVNPLNGLNTISLNVHTHSNIQKASNSSKYPMKNNEIQLDIPTLNYITPKTSTQKTFNDRHFQNL